MRHRAIVYKVYLLSLITSFGANPNVLQICPLSDVYVVNVIHPLCMLLMFNH